jgi:hypothetical protein
MLSMMPALGSGLRPRRHAQLLAQGSVQMFASTVQTPQAE